MAGWKRRILGIAVISAGVCAALPFRNETLKSPGGDREGTPSHEAAVVRNDLTLQLVIPPAPVAVPASAAGDSPTAFMTETKTQPLAQEIRRDETQAPPNIASTFEPLVATYPQAAEESSPPPQLTKPAQVHRIVDGDSLEALAERYLGSRGLWRSIFEANQGLLTDRDILPIGGEIQIPEVPLPSPDEDDDLVPIPAGILNSDE